MYGGAGAAGAGGGAAAAAVIAQAIKASGAIVRMSPQDFLQIVERSEEPLVVSAQGGFFSTKHEYLTGYRGLAFYAKSSEPLALPEYAEVVVANKIWIPG
jgi:hypothetical protein